MTNNEILQTYHGLKSDTYSIKVCDECGKEYKHFTGEVIYSIGKKTFCSYNCKCKYKKEHENEESNKTLKVFSTKKCIIEIIKKANSFEALTRAIETITKQLYNYKAREGTACKIDNMGRVDYETYVKKYQL